MKIRTISTSTNKPLAKTQLQLQVRGKDSGYITVTTDQNGEFSLDQKYSGQQIASMTGGQGAWLTAAEGSTLRVGSTTGTTTATGGAKQKERQSTTK
jgi:hypothetical protein